jgi:hypothetical protein
MCQKPAQTVAKYLNEYLAGCSVTVVEGREAADFLAYD